MMDQDIVRHARVAFLMLAEQTRPEAIPDAAKVVKALSKFAALGKALDVEQVSDEDAANLLKIVFRGDTRVNS